MPPASLAVQPHLSPPFFSSLLTAHRDDQDSGARKRKAPPDGIRDLVADSVETYPVGAAGAADSTCRNRYAVHRRLLIRLVDAVEARPVGAACPAHADGHCPTGRLHHVA